MMCLPMPFPMCLLRGRWVLVLYGAMHPADGPQPHGSCPALRPASWTCVRVAGKEGTRHAALGAAAQPSATAFLMRYRTQSQVFGSCV
jgi:hypothetical protein